MNIEEIKKDIVRYNDLYRRGTPEISDEDYDDLLENLKSEVPENEYESFVSTLNEGRIETGDRKKVEHKFIAGSLEKLKYDEPEAVKDFIDKNGGEMLSISAKVDGLSGILHYVNGVLVSMATRGDGYRGEDITDKAAYIKGIPKELPNGFKLFDCYIRGEIVILKEDFGKFEGIAKRNIVAGVINRKEWKPSDVSNLSFIAYTVMGDKFNKSSQFEYLERCGFNVVWHEKVFFGPGETASMISETLKGYAEMMFPYETDGLVICNSGWVNENKYRPDGCKAFKLNQNMVETRLVDVIFQGPHKDGGFTPVGIVDPVEVSGAIVTKCTLNNLDFIEQNNIKLGSHVRLIRSGEVIPKILSAWGDEDECVEIKPPEECPSCGSLLIREGPHLRCPNEDCKTQKLYKITNFIRTLGVENASFATIEKLGLDSIQALIDWRPNPKYKSEMKLYSDITRIVFTKRKDELLKALNFNGLSDILLSRIIDFYGWDFIVENAEIGFGAKGMYLKKGLPDGIGEVLLDKFFRRIRPNMANVEKICADPRWKPGPEPSAKSAEICHVKGSICFTGTLPTMGRSEASKLAEKAGFEVKNSVSKGLTYLVMADPNSNSTKAKKAREYGTKLLGEGEFLELVKNSEEVAIDEI